MDATTRTSFLSGLPELQRARTERTLDALIHARGQTTTRAALVEALVREGWRVERRSVPDEAGERRLLAEIHALRDAPMNPAHPDRVKLTEKRALLQSSLTREERRLVEPGEGGAFYAARDLGELAMDYAEHLTGGFA